MRRNTEGKTIIQTARPLDDSASPAAPAQDGYGIVDASRLVDFEGHSLTQAHNDKRTRGFPKPQNFRPA